MKKGIAIVLSACLLCMPLTVSAVTYDGYTQEEFDALQVTTVIASQDSPTGYYVTFRYPDAGVDRVRIYGEWSFTDPHKAGLGGKSMNASPDEWQNGYINYGSWPTAEMTFNEAAGVWEYTIPLPSGSWGYRFYVGGAEGADLKDYTDAVISSDPHNMPLIYDYEAEDKTNDEYLSIIYVPYDAEKQSLCYDYSLEAPFTEGEGGTVLFDAVEVSDGSTASFGIYLPPAFDASREEPYPILVLLHGGGGTESSWINQASLKNVMDNLTAQGKVEPTIIVTPNCTDYGSRQFVFDRPMIMSNVIDYILPHMVEKYNASQEASRRGFGGLSMGGATTFYALFNFPEEFDYYLPMSGFISKEYEPDYTMEILKEKKVGFGAGLNDFCLADTGEDFMATAKMLTIMNNFSANGIDYVSDLVPTGHDWGAWRRILAYMLEYFLWK